MWPGFRSKTCGCRDAYWRVIALVALMFVYTFLYGVNVSGSASSVFHGIPEKLTTSSSAQCNVSYCHPQATDSNEDDFTIVTAFFDIGRYQWRNFKRNTQDYIAYSQNVLKLDVNLVAFVNKQKYKDHIISKRAEYGHSNKTIVHMIKANDLTFAYTYHTINKIMGSKEFKSNNPLLKHPEGFSVWYNILMNSKVGLVKRVANENPFRTSYFFWLDFGYGHGNKVYPKTPRWSPKNIMNNTDKITYIELYETASFHSIDEMYKKAISPVMNGGFFGGHALAIRNYFQFHKQVFTEWLAKKRIDDDQTLALACYLKNPSLFNVVRGGWYDVFKLFH